jgi:hypothetical protein
MQKSELTGAEQGAGWEAAAMIGLLALALVPPDLIERLPSVCLNQRLFGFCPGCGSLRALSHFFHGDLAGAVRLNWNVLVIAPLVAGLALAAVLAKKRQRPA